jgi:hypothetical protein
MSNPLLLAIPLFGVRIPLNRPIDVRTLVVLPSRAASSSEIARFGPVDLLRSQLRQLPSKPLVGRKHLNLDQSRTKCHWE